MNNKITQEQHQKIHELTKQGRSAWEISSDLGVGKTSVKKYRRIPIQNNTEVKLDSVDKSSQEISENNWNIVVPRTRINSEASLISEFKIDTNTWLIKKLWFRVVDKSPENEPFYEVKAYLERKVGLELVRKELDSLKEEAKIVIPEFKPFHLSNQDAGNLLEITIPDLHIGKMGWGEETGYSDYDSKIACDIFETALSKLIYRLGFYQFDKIVFPIGNDLMNCDSRGNMTTGGTPQDVDSRYQKTFKTTRLLITKAINNLRQLGPVTVLTIPGNHDTESAWHLGDSLECYFHNTSDVVIDNRPIGRKYLQFGKVMLLWLHGDRGKVEDYPLLMATEQPEMFAATKYREAHIGHRHQKETIERHGVRVKVLPSLAGSDYYHSSNNYTGNLRQAEAMVWNVEEGLINTAVYTVPNN